VVVRVLVLVRVPSSVVTYDHTSTVQVACCAARGAAAAAVAVAAAGGGGGRRAEILPPRPPRDWARIVPLFFIQ
jgi:hypothetical protein